MGFYPVFADSETRRNVLVGETAGEAFKYLMKLKMNENMVRTNSQDCGADEISYTAGIALFNKINQLIR